MMNMRRVLLDNATLSGVERLLGFSKIRNLNYVDNDILCFEKLLNAILFSDQIICVDDYKKEYSSKRIEKFNFIEFKKIDQNVYHEVSKEAAGFAKSMAFGFEGSKPAGDAIHFFEALKISPQLRWDIWVSSEYLTLSFLVDRTDTIDREASIDSVFRHESVDHSKTLSQEEISDTLFVSGRDDINNIKDLIQSLKSENPQFAGTDSKSALQRIIFGYGWAAERSFFYNKIAEIWGADTYLAPLRDAFCESCCRIDFGSDVTALIENIKSNSQKALASILEPTGQAKFIMRLPFFTAYLISKTDTPAQCIELALSMRMEKDFQQCRDLFQNMNHISTSEKRKELNSIMKYLEDNCAEIMSKYSVNTGNGQQFSFSLGFAGPSVATSIKLGQLFKPYRNKPIVRVFRNIVQDMINVERLGALSKKLRSSIVEHQEATYPRISATPKFMEHRENERGRPAYLKK